MEKQPFLRYNHTEKINLPSFWYQKFDQYLLNNLHITSKLSIGRNFRRRTVEDLWNQIALIKTSFELMKNYFINIFLAVARLSRKN